MGVDRLHNAPMVRKIIKKSIQTDWPNLTIKRGKSTNASTERESRTNAWKDDARREAKQMDPKIAALKDKELETTAADTP